MRAPRGGSQWSERGLGGRKAGQGRAVAAVAASLWAVLVTLSAPARGDDGSQERLLKLTLGDYRYSGGYDGQDLNLRWRRNGTDLWLGAYHDPAFGTQTRTGYDTSISFGSSASLQPSLQAASGGFVGGSLTFQVGAPWFALAGWGRTNLRPYFNLNFDPNDAITAGIGWNGDAVRSVTLTVIADDRLHTAQKDWHLNGRWPLNHEVLATLDVLRKTGEGDSGYVRAWGWSATLDISNWFIRLARDPKQNFSDQDATRLVAGVRF